VVTRVAIAGHRPVSARSKERSARVPSGAIEQSLTDGHDQRGVRSLDDLKTLKTGGSKLVSAWRQSYWNEERPRECVRKKTRPPKVVVECAFPFISSLGGLRVLRSYLGSIGS